MKNYLKLKSAKLLFITLILLLPTVLLGQSPEDKKYFFPIKPGKQNFLTANMGELRNNHFHSGMDVKTDGRTGYPVYATTDGYVCRVKVSAYGYGNVVYIRHANNMVTVYAHLEKFNGPIGDYIRKKQYEQKSFQIELYPKATELPVKKGEIIGLAGNSGGSQGPHLHYELRDTSDKLFNPVKFNFSEIVDNIPPVFVRLGILPLNTNSRVSNEFSRKEFPIVKTTNEYSIPSIIQANGLIGLELKALDKKNSVHYSYGINKAQVWVDDKLIFTSDLSSFTFDKSRFINEHINYPLFVKTGKRFERLYVADGNKIDIYNSSSPLKGRLLINEARVYKVKVVITDEYDNHSTLNFKIQGVENPKTTVNSSGITCSSLDSEIIENTLKLFTKPGGDTKMNLYFKGKEVALSPAYKTKEATVFLYDLRTGLPDSAKAGRLTEKFNFVKMIPSGTQQQVTFENLSISIPANALADTIFLELKKPTVGDKVFYHVHNTTVSLFDTITIGIIPEGNIEDKSRTFIYSGSGSKLSFEGGIWKGNKIEAKTRNLGKFTLAVDTIKPTIRFISNYGNSIKLNIWDDFSGIYTFNATLDGYWILMNYDPKKRLIWSERLDKTVPLKGKFQLQVKDNAGNIQEFSIDL